MKDESRAKWPDNMVAEGPVRNINPCAGEPDICTVAVGGIFIHGLNFDEVEARGYQICALPQMVALLKEIAEHDETFWYDRAQSILKSIGEGE
jgi:hypothetical protein